MTVVARQFSSPEALKKYLQEHPKADPSKHSVKGEKPKDESKGESKGDGKKDKSESKGTSAIDDAIDEAIQEFMKKEDLTEGEKKRVLEQAISDSETESKGEARKKVKDFSKEEGFEALEGLSSAEQRKVIERALKMASARVQELQEQAVRVASSDPKTAYSLIDRTLDGGPRTVTRNIVESVAQQHLQREASRVALSDPKTAYDLLEKTASAAEVKTAGFSQRTMRAQFEQFAFDVLNTVYEYVEMLHRRVSRQTQFRDVPGFLSWDVSQGVRGNGNVAEGRVWLKGGLAMDGKLDGTLNITLTLEGNGIQLEATDYKTPLVSRRFKLESTASSIGMAVGEAWEKALTGSVDYGD